MGLKSFYFLCRTYICLIALTSSSTTWAISYSNIYIFGDSLSDTDASLLNGNGPLWPEYLAPQLGITYDPGTNYALSGSFSFDLANQVSAYQATTVADPNALYVVWAGGNDILFGLDGAVAANNVINTVNSLSLFGANNFLIPNMPDLGMAPVNNSTLTVPSINFNSTIDLAYASSSNVEVADVFGLHHQIISDPAAFGLVNVTDACFTGTVCANPDEYLFWDQIHPTTVGHSLIADEFAMTLATIPIPATVWLFGSGILSLFGVARRKSA